MSTEFGQWRYEGSWQTPIPNALISDKRLSPSALKLWIVLRAAIQPGQTLAPTYDYLVDQCNLSRSTVSRCIKVLRALRWIQTKQVMTATGWLSGSMYRMFDSPIAITEIAPLDADYPGFCRVILHRHLGEMTDLPQRERMQVMNVVFAVESAVRSLYRPDKINLASLGNMTPHVHWHLIPRWRDDRHIAAQYRLRQSRLCRLILTLKLQQAQVKLIQRLLQPRCRQQHHIRDSHQLHRRRLRQHRPLVRRQTKRIARRFRQCTRYPG